MFKWAEYEHACQICFIEQKCNVYMVSVITVIVMGYIIMMAAMKAKTDGYSWLVDWMITVQPAFSALQY